MVSHYYKCIFIHIPKSAGTSIKSLLGKKEITKLSKDHINPFFLGDKKFEPPAPHLRAIDYLKYKYVTKEIFDKYFKFAFVRNPWDRLVSEYKFRHHPRKCNFKTYLFHHFPTPSWSDEYCHILPQYDFLYDNNDNLLVDFVGRYENLKQDFNKVCDILGISERNLSHENKSLSLKRNFLKNPVETVKILIDLLSITARKNTYSSYVEYYDEESKEYVAELYKKDIEAFNYNFEGNDNNSKIKNYALSEAI